MRSFLIALQFLTILPINIKPELQKEELGRSLVWFPVIGALIGLLLSAGLILSGFLPYLVVAALILTVCVIITGGIHLDGFADTCDGLFGFTTKERALEIMRDSHIGCMAAVSITILLVLKFSILASFRPEALLKNLIFMATFARWSQVLACYLSKYVRENGKAKYFIEYAGRKELIIGALFTVILSVLFFERWGLILFSLSVLVVLLSINYIKGKLGGMTGDTLGAINEVAEVAVLLFSLIYLRRFNAW